MQKGSVLGYILYIKYFSSQNTSVSVILDVFVFVWWMWLFSDCFFFRFFQINLFYLCLCLCLCGYRSFARMKNSLKDSVGVGRVDYSQLPTEEGEGEEEGGEDSTLGLELGLGGLRGLRTSSMSLRSGVSDRVV